MWSAGQVGELPPDGREIPAGGQVAQNERHRNPGAFDARFASKNVGIAQDMVAPIHAQENGATSPEGESFAPVTPQAPPQRSRSRLADAASSWLNRPSPSLSNFSMNAFFR